MVAFCREGKGSLSISLHVQPRARKTEIIGVHGDALKVKVAAQPVDGEANEELIEFFAEFLKIPKSQIEIRRGGQSRHKIIDVTGVTTAALVELLMRHGFLTLKLG